MEPAVPPMSIVCPNCGATFRDANAGTRGRSERRVIHCAGCTCTWLVTRSTQASARITAAEAKLTAMTIAPRFAPEIIDAAVAISPRARPKIKSSPPRRRRHGAPDAPGADRARPGFLPGIIALQLLAVAAVLLGRAEAVRALPEAASLFRAIGLPVNLRGLVLAGVTTRTERQDGVAVLTVEGRIESDSGSPIAVPPLRFALRDAAGTELYAWTVPSDVATLEPGESLAFQTRMASPPSGGSDVLVRFARPSDG
jgi:hypothetical protein